LDYLRKVEVKKDKNGKEDLKIGGLLYDLQFRDNILIPRDESDLGIWLEFSRFLMETVINLYRLSNQKPIVGGPVTLLGISPFGIRYYYSVPSSFRGQSWAEIISAY
jgi:hypothetical protein